MTALFWVFHFHSFKMFSFASGHGGGEGSWKPNYETNRMPCYQCHILWQFKKKIFIFRCTFLILTHFIAAIQPTNISSSVQYSPEKFPVTLTRVLVPADEVLTNNGTVQQLVTYLCSTKLKQTNNLSMF